MTRSESNALKWAKILLQKPQNFTDICLVGTPTCPPPPFFSVQTSVKFSNFCSLHSKHFHANSSRTLGREQKKRNDGGGESFSSPLPLPFFLLPLQLLRYNLTRDWKCLLHRLRLLWSNIFVSFWQILYKLGIFPIFNPLSPNGDQHQFSPNNIHTLSRNTVMTINKMIIKEKVPWSFIKFSQHIL